MSGIMYERDKAHIARILIRRGRSTVHGARLLTISCGIICGLRGAEPSMRFLVVTDSPGGTSVGRNPDGNCLCCLLCRGARPWLQLLCLFHVIEGQDPREQFTQVRSRWRRKG